ncbi:methyltransferase domain-containing protein [Paenibacillus sp. CMAA1364]
MSIYDYDNYYQEMNYFGNPYPEMVEYFLKSKKRGTLCDLGAGQGRDSIPFFHMRFDVTAVDVSVVGLNDIHDKCPEVKTVLHDIYTFNTIPYDTIFMNSMLHFYKNDCAKEKGLVIKILDEMSSGNQFINCIIKDKESEFLKIINDYGNTIQIIYENDVSYVEADIKYHFCVIEKTDG